MKKLHLLILRSFIGPFVLIFFIVLFVLLMQFLWRYIDELVGKGLDTKTIAEFLMYTSATLVPMALPLSILMSSLMTFGNLGESYELTAIKSSGISLQRVMKPLFFIVIIVSLGAFFFANNVLPYAQLQMRSLLYDIRHQRPDLKIKPGEFNNLISGYSLRVGSKNTESNTLYDVRIYDHTLNKGNTSVTLADSGTLKLTKDEKYVLLNLYNGHGYEELQDQSVSVHKRSYPHRYDKFREEQIIIELSGFNFERSDQSIFKDHYAMMNLKQLGHIQDSLTEDIQNKQDYVDKMLISNSLFKKHDHPVVYKPRNTIQNEPDITQNPAFSHKARTERAILDSLKTLEQKAVKPVQPVTATIPKKEKESAKAITQKAIKIVDFDSIINVLTLREQIRVATSAVTYSRSAKNVLENSIQSINYKIKTMRRYEIEWHRKFTIAFACLVFFFIGAPLGAIIRKGGLGLPLVISVIFFIFYYVLSLTTEKMVRESILSGAFGMWISSVVFLITGVFLTYKATTDSSMLNMDTYLIIIKKFFSQKTSVVDNLSVVSDLSNTPEAKIQNISNALINLEESVNRVSESVKINSYLPDLLVSLYTTQPDTNVILFERLYNNTFRIIINHPIFHDKNVRAKIYEFPAFQSRDYFDDKSWKRILKVVLACLPPLTLIVFIRQLIKMYLLESKLKQIKTLIPELVSTINETQQEL